MYNFFGNFLAVYIIVLGIIIGWFIFQMREETRLLKLASNKNIE